MNASQEIIDLTTLLEKTFLHRSRFFYSDAEFIIKYVERLLALRNHEDFIDKPITT